ncbi:hypothetical protein ACGFZP_24815 [Kitasatospora sp. NPDC048239]|uniref:hypothetical protein n=1 Tax=Kitasatospora sp. NPDC048239 TaxID=3364046 RepID=UPI00371DE90E
MSSEISRRGVLKGTAATGLLVAGAGAVSAQPAAAAPRTGAAADRAQAGAAPQPGVRNARTSANGWRMENAVDAGGAVWTRPLPGTTARLAVRIGQVETVLVHLARRYHYEVAELRAEEVAGWRSPEGIRSSALAESNLASGTAVALRPGSFPPGVQGGYLPYELQVIRDILAELDGVVAWGGDDKHVDEGLFYLAVPPGDARLKAVADRIRGWSEAPGSGAGTTVDVQAPDRRKAAQRVEQQQRSATR